MFDIVWPLNHKVGWVERLNPGFRSLWSLNHKFPDWNPIFFMASTVQPKLYDVYGWIHIFAQVIQGVSSLFFMASTVQRFNPPRVSRKTNDSIARALATSFFCPSSCSMPCGTSKGPSTGDEPQQPMSRLPKRWPKPSGEAKGGRAAETAGVGWASFGWQWQWHKKLVGGWYTYLTPLGKKKLDVAPGGTIQCAW